MKKTHLEASFILSGYLCKDLNVKNLELFVYSQSFINKIQLF